MLEQESAAQAVVWLADAAARRGWLPATSGNLSVRIADNPLSFAITRSGADKTQLRVSDVLRVDARCQALDETAYRPSAETGVHARLYAKFPCRSIVHVHTVWNNVVSQVYFPQGGVLLSDHELLKALDHWGKDASITLPIVENHHDLRQLEQAVEAAATATVPGVLVRNHGIYAWGDSAATAWRNLEAFEFLFQYHVTMIQWDRQT